MLHNHLQDVVGKVAELLTYRILCECRLKGMSKNQKKHENKSLPSPEEIKVWKFCSLEGISLVKFVDVVQKEENKR